MAEIAEMREEVKKAFAGKQETEQQKAWARKMRTMPDNQVTAIYLKLQAEKRKTRRKEWEDYPLYVG